MSKLATCLIFKQENNIGWKQTKSLRNQARKTEADSGAMRGSVRSHSVLFNNNLSKAIKSKQDEIRDRLNADFTSYNDRGTYLVPSGKVFDLKAWIDKQIDDFEKLKTKLREEYSSFIEQEQERLGGIFDPEAYHPVEQVIEDTFVRYSFEPMPEQSRFSELFNAESELQELRKVFEDSEDRLSKRIRRQAIARIDKACTKCLDVLNAYHRGGTDGKRLDSKVCVKFTKELAEAIELDLTDDEELRGFVNELPVPLAESLKDLDCFKQFEKNVGAMLDGIHGRKPVEEVEPVLEQVIEPELADLPSFEPEQEQEQEQEIEQFVEIEF